MENEKKYGRMQRGFSSEKPCKCGKIHNAKTPLLILENGAINRLKELIVQCEAKKVYLIEDSNTERVAGKQVEEIIDELSISCTKCVFKERRLTPDEFAVGRAIMFYDNSCDLIIAVGSGVINDIGKIVAAVANKTYFIVATAPSMDGYASSTSSMASSTASSFVVA